MGGDLTSTDRVVVGVNSCISRVAIEEDFRNGTDVVCVGVGDTTCAQAGFIECTVSGIGSSEEAGN